MLQSIRDRTQGWIAGIIISILILSFAIFGIHSYLEGGSASTVVAKVNDVEITKNQLAVAYERLRRQLQIQYSNNYALPPGAEVQLKERALRTLINIQLLKQASIKQNYRISDSQIDGLLASMPDFQVDGQFSLARFQQMLSTTMFSAADFLDLLKTSLLIDQPRLGLMFSSFALPIEIQRMVALVNQEREIQYAVFPLQSVTQAIIVSDDQIKAYYADHQADYKTQEQASIDYLEINLKDLIADMHPSDAELEKFYNENSNSFTQAMQWKLAAILVPVPVKAGEKEVAAAQAKITDIQSKLNAGEKFEKYSQQYPLGKAGEKFQAGVTLNQIPADLQNAVIKLTKAEQVSEPVKTDSGFVIIKALHVSEPKIESFTSVKTKVKDLYIHQQAEEKFAALKDKLANLTYEHPESLQTAAQALSLPIKTSELFTQEKGGKDISSNAKVREATFSHDVMNLKNNSDVIQVGADAVLVIRIKEHIPAAILTLEAVKKQITDKLKLVAQEAELGKLVNDIKTQLTKGASSDALAQQYHFTWSQSAYIGRHQAKIDTAIANAAFAMPKPKNSSAPVYAVVKTQDGYAIIALHAVRDGVLGAKQDQNDLFNEQIQAAEGSLEYELYQYSLEKQAKIKLSS